MIELINYIDEQISGCVPDVTSNGLCHLLEDTNGMYPAVVGEQSKKVTPNKGDAIMIYHRLLNGAFTDREDLSFGKKKSLQNAQRVRMVVFVDLSLEVDHIDDIINALPAVFEVDGYRFCNVNPAIDLIRDRAAIWQQEFAEAHMKAFQMKYHVYAVEYTLEYIKCSVCESVSPQ